MIKPYHNCTKVTRLYKVMEFWQEPKKCQATTYWMSGDNPMKARQAVLWSLLDNHLRNADNLLTTSRWSPDDHLTTAWQSWHFLTSTWWLPFDRLTTLLLDNRLTTDRQLPDNCLTIAQQAPNNFLTNSSLPDLMSSFLPSFKVTGAVKCKYSGLI